MYQKLRDRIRPFFSITTKTTFIAALLIMVCIPTIYNLRKAIVISIDGSDTEIITYSKDLKSALEKQHIVLGPKDKILPALDTPLKNRDKVSIKRAFPVHVIVDGKDMEVNTSEKTINDMLATEGITYSVLDRIEPAPTENLKSEMKVLITRIETKILNEYEPIDFSTVIKNDDSLMDTVKKVTQEGQPGEKKLTLKVMLENGKEVSKELIQELITRQPTERIILQGTLSAARLTRGGEFRSKETFIRTTPQDLSYKDVLNCVATAYSSQEDGIGTRTASGRTVNRDPNGYSTIAVDPRVIPLGTRVYVEGYGYAIACDTGGAIKGNKIDIYLDTIADCYNWGRRNVNVYILN